MPPSHGGNAGSNPAGAKLSSYADIVRVSFMFWRLRATAVQAVTSDVRPPETRLVFSNPTRGISSYSVSYIAIAFFVQVSLTCTTRPFVSVNDDVIVSVLLVAI